MVLITPCTSMATHLMAAIRWKTKSFPGFLRSIGGTLHNIHNLTRAFSALYSCQTGEKFAVYIFILNVSVGQAQPIINLYPRGGRVIETAVSLPSGAA